MPLSREIHLTRRPTGQVSESDFRLVETAVSPPGAGEVLVRNVLQSVDPWMVRAIGEAISEKPAGWSKFGPAIVGAPLQGAAIGRVVDTRAPSLREGDLVLSMEGWREYFVAAADTLEKLPQTDLPPEAYLGIAGLTGLTAWGGVVGLANAGPEDTIFVTAAAGAVGTAACQFAKISGATIIGCAGGHRKAKFLRELGVDEVIDHRNCDDLGGALSAAAPDGISVHFENVGGPLLAAGLNSARPKARIVLCGLIRSFAGEPQTFPGDLMRVIRQRWRILGLSAGDFMPQMKAFRNQVSEWMSEGKLKMHHTIDVGIDSAPGALLKLMSGENIGKMLVALE